MLHLLTLNLHLLHFYLPLQILQPFLFILNLRFLLSYPLIQPLMLSMPLPILNLQPLLINNLIFNKNIKRLIKIHNRQAPRLHQYLRLELSFLLRLFDLPVSLLDQQSQALLLLEQRTDLLILIRVLGLIDFLVEFQVLFFEDEVIQLLFFEVVLHQAEFAPVALGAFGPEEVEVEVFEHVLEESLGFFLPDHELADLEF